MPALPRIVTVDPSGDIARIVRAAFDLTERSVIQIDIPDSADTLEEIRRVAPEVVICALTLDDHMRGIDLAMLVKQMQPTTQVVVIAGDDDVEALDDDVLAEASFIYLRRPLEATVFIRALFAALDGEDAKMTMSTPAVRVPTPADLGPIPSMDLNAAQRILDTLVQDVAAQSCVLATRMGDVILERGVPNYLNISQLTSALLPSIMTNVEMGQIVGGSKPATIQFFDGQTYDVFVLSVGLHFFLCLMYDGKDGSRSFGAVTRFGRRAVEDLIAPLGASAFVFERPTAPVSEDRRRRRRTAAVTPKEETIEPVAVKAEVWSEPVPPKPTETALEIPRLEPISDLDVSIFEAGAVEAAADLDLDDLFDPDKLAQIANETRRERGPLTYDEARELGIIP
jgi:DNA-binding NarL/FixJ family response regulator